MEPEIWNHDYSESDSKKIVIMITDSIQMREPLRNFIIAKK